jgi:dihydrofolate reductase
MPKTIIISAMTKKGKVIGKNNWLPWEIPEELQMFRRLTINSTVIMGRKTYDSVGRPMPKRHNIVLSRKPNLADERVEWARSMEDALEKAKVQGKDIFIIGGHGIYKEGIPYSDKMYLSYIKNEYSGDTNFPEWDETDWEIEKKEDYNEFEFVIYGRKK